MTIPAAAVGPRINPKGHDLSLHEKLGKPPRATLLFTAHNSYHN